MADWISVPRAPDSAKDRLLLQLPASLLGDAAELSTSGLASGFIYGPRATTSSFAPVTSTTYYFPTYIPQTATFNALIVRTHAGYAGNATIRLGVYNNLNDKPTTVVFDAGTVATALSNTRYTKTINQTLTAGWYWIAFNAQPGAGTNNFVSSFQWDGLPFVRIGINNANSPCWLQSGVTGAFATAGTLVDTTTAPVVWMGVA